MTQDVHLLVDVGNSRIKWSRASDDKDQDLQPAASFAWELELLPNILDNNWSSIRDNVTQVSISNVAGDKVQDIISQWCNDHWQITPQFAATGEQFGNIKNGYNNYQNLGIDRWMAVIAAHQLYPQYNNIIIDCGSAITVDGVLSDGEHLPGPIIPGLHTMLSSLLGNTDLSKYMPDENTGKTDLRPPQAIVNDTENAILSGAKFAAIRALEAVIEEMEGQITQPGIVNIISTGGEAQILMPLSTLSTRQNYMEQPELVLKGLARFFENN